MRMLGPLMTLHHAIILNGLQELSNASASGQEGQVTFEANGNEHWLQCSPARVHMDWPFASAPTENETLRACFGNSVQILAWDPDGYATLVPGSKDVEALITGIDLVFQDLYGLGPEYTLTYRLGTGDGEKAS